MKTIREYRRCHNCEHWEKEPTHNEGQCKNPDVLSYVFQDMLRTGPLFGCNHHKFYCEEHNYTPPQNSGFSLCPKCEMKQ